MMRKIPFTKRRRGAENGMTLVSSAPLRLL